MPKDPAMLFYWSDWNSGTILLSRFLKGCYMDVLSAEFNNGPLSLEEIKICLGSDFGSSWPAIQKKFKQTGEGLFFNERLEREKQKRLEFTESRRSNRKKTYDTSYEKHMIPHMENENRNENINEIKEEEKGVGKGEGFFLNEISMDLELTKIEVIACQEFIAIACKKNLSPAEVCEQWQAFKINNFKGREWYGSHEKLMIHFRHSLKNELNKSNGSNSKIPGKATGKDAGAYELLEKIRKDYTAQ